MVRGLEKFKETFKNYAGQYVFIGGTACDILMAHEGLAFRQTKDLDIVLIVEALDKVFVNSFISFIGQAGYAHINKGTGQNQFYRFEKPQNKEYPYMIELFSRCPENLSGLEKKLAPIHISDNVISLSAILLDEIYYQMLVQNVQTVEGISVLNMETLILFKIKAWLDMTERKRNGENIDSKNINKHKNDVFRLVVGMSPEKRMSLSKEVKTDVIKFIETADLKKIVLKDIGIQGISHEDIIKKIKECYMI